MGCCHFSLSGLKYQRRSSGISWAAQSSCLLPDMISIVPGGNPVATWAMATQKGGQCGGRVYEQDMTMYMTMSSNVYGNVYKAMYMAMYMAMSSNVWQCMETYCNARQCSQWVYVPPSFHNGPLHPDLTGLQRSRGKKKYGRKQTLITLHWKINQLLKVEYNWDIRFPIVLFVPYQARGGWVTLAAL